MCLPPSTIFSTQCGFYDALFPLKLNFPKERKIQGGSGIRETEAIVVIMMVFLPFSLSVFLSVPEFEKSIQ